MGYQFSQVCELVSERGYKLSQDAGLYDFLLRWSKRSRGEHAVTDTEQALVKIILPVKDLNMQ